MLVLRSLEDGALPLDGTAVALGMFDGVHQGHQEVLGTAVAEAKRRGLTPGAFTFALSDPRPNFKQSPILTDSRMLEYLLKDQGMGFILAPTFESMRNLGPEDYVKHVLGEKLGAKLVCVGENFTFAKGGLGKTQDLKRIGEAMGMTVMVLPLLTMGGETVSSSRIRSLVEDGDIAGANELLGRFFAIDFPVVHGNRIGKTLGTPTINQPFPEDFVIPKFGVYATLAQVDGVEYCGVTNVGVKPTVGSDIPLAETYIQDFSGNLYGRSIKISFLDFIRTEVKFQSLEELREHIMEDAQIAQEMVQPYLDSSRYTVS